MPIRAELPSFWWYNDHSVGGMSRPGFSRVDWDELHLEEAMLLSWLGKLETQQASLEDLGRHLDWYQRMVNVFGLSSDAEVERSREALSDWKYAQQRLGSLAERTHVLEGVGGSEGTDRPDFEFSRNHARTRHEVEHLGKHGVDVLVALTESAPDPVVRESELEVHHIPVGDMRPPTHAQVEEFARLLESCLGAERSLVVHCLAGIGRTSTMIMAGHVLLGHELDDVRARVEERNPRFRFVGEQWNFLRSLAARA